MPPRFEEMTVEQVYVRTGREGGVQRGKPRYADRAWTQLHDEMIDGQARTVRDLPRARSRALRAATKAQATSLEATRRRRRAQASQVNTIGGTDLLTPVGPST